MLLENVSVLLLAHCSDTCGSIILVRSKAKDTGY